MRNTKRTNIGLTIAWSIAITIALIATMRLAESKDVVNAMRVCFDERETINFQITDSGRLLCQSKVDANIWYTVNE
jgi:hypothetical protein